MPLSFPPFFSKKTLDPPGFNGHSRKEPTQPPWMVRHGDNQSPHVSNEKNPGCLVYIRDYTTQLYRDYNKPL